MQVCVLRLPCQLLLLHFPTLNRIFILNFNIYNMFIETNNCFVAYQYQADHFNFSLLVLKTLFTFYHVVIWCTDEFYKSQCSFQRVIYTGYNCCPVILSISLSLLLLKSTDMSHKVYCCVSRRLEMSHGLHSVPKLMDQSYLT